MYIDIYTRLHTHLHTNTYTHTLTHTHLCIYTCIQMCIHTRIHVYHIFVGGGMFVSSSLCCSMVLVFELRLVRFVLEKFRSLCLQVCGLPQEICFSLD